MLGIYDYALGTAQIASVFLMVVAGIIALSMFRSAHREEELKAWKWLIIALVLFAVEEVFGALKSFGIFSTPYLTHIIPSFILIFLITALVVQLQVNRGWFK
ncbi:hypothetical protein J4457_03080 [Candidatus Woesearchaeota archaeon]|nr:hypothetical protein [Candidatus Woesearchaeota archaeon]